MDTDAARARTPAGRPRGTAEVLDASQTLYAQIRRVAAGQLRAERRGHTLCPTDLANEAVLRLIDSGGGEGVDRGELLRRAARQCRQILVDHARRRNRLKRGGGRPTLSLSTDPAAAYHAHDVLELDEALGALARLDPRQADVVTMRLFAGMSMPQIAQALGVSLRTVEGDWAFARAWLRRELMPAPEPAPAPTPTGAPPP